MIIVIIYIIIATIFLMNIFSIDFIIIDITIINIIISIRIFFLETNFLIILEIRNMMIELLLVRSIKYILLIEKVSIEIIKIFITKIN